MQGIAALTLCVAAMSSEGATLDMERNGLFGWLGSWHYCWRVVYLGVCPGILGHVSFNALLKYLNPLLIALPCTIEPLLGSMIGLALGIGSPPGIFTYSGGAVLLVATVSTMSTISVTIQSSCQLHDFHANLEPYRHYQVVYLPTTFMQAVVIFASHKREQATLAAETSQKGAEDDGTGEVELVVDTLPVEGDTNVQAQEGSPLLRPQGPIMK